MRGGYACELFNGIGLGVIVAAAKDGLFCRSRGDCRKGKEDERGQKAFHCLRLADWPVWCNSLHDLLSGLHQTLVAQVGSEVSSQGHLTQAIGVYHIRDTERRILTILFLNQLFHNFFIVADFFGFILNPLCC